MVKDRKERFRVLPFSIGCICRSGVDVASSTNPALDQCNNPKSDVNIHVVVTGERGEGPLEENVNVKDKTFDSLVIPKRDLRSGIHTLIKRIKSLPQVFVYREEEDDEDDRAMEIGYPTDVKHLTHIGLDGSTINMYDHPLMVGTNLENLKKPTHEMFSIPSISRWQFELAMAAQASSDHHDQPRPGQPL